MADSTDAPEYVRVPVETLVDYRGLLAAIGEARQERNATRADLLAASSRMDAAVVRIEADLRTLRAELAAHVAAESPVLHAHGEYLRRIEAAEQEVAADATARRRAADADAEAATAERLALRSRYAKWAERALWVVIVAAAIAGERWLLRIVPGAPVPDPTPEVRHAP